MQKPKTQNTNDKRAGRLNYKFQDKNVIKEYVTGYVWCKILYQYEKLNYTAVSSNGKPT